MPHSHSKHTLSSDSDSSDDDFNMVQATPQAVMATATQVRGRVRPTSKLYIIMKQIPLL